MKTDLHALARALTELALTLPAEQLPSLADAAMEYLSTHGRPHDAQKLPGIVRRFLRRHGPPSVTVETPDPLSAADRTVLADSFAEMLGRTISFHTRENQTLLGGARVQIGDDRFDFSLRGALDRLGHAFTSIHS